MRNRPRKRWMIWWMLSVLVAGCATAQDERVKEFNDDGLHLFARGDYQAARDSFEMALTLSPHDEAILFNVGQCQDRLGDWRRAEQYYITCLQINPNYGDARHGMASLLYRTGRVPEAHRMIDDWIKSDPNRADAVALEGWRFRQEKNLPRAQERLQQALAMEPNNRRALIELGIVYERMNMPERALVLYERVLAKSPNQPDIAQRVEQLRGNGVKRPLPD
jgi:tetratricopeptide (TPR) repeat protein